MNTIKLLGTMLILMLCILAIIASWYVIIILAALVGTYFTAKTYLFINDVNKEVLYE